MEFDPTPTYRPKPPSVPSPETPAALWVSLCPTGPPLGKNPGSAPCTQDWFCYLLLAKICYPTNKLISIPASPIQLIVSPYECTYGGYYGLVVITLCPPSPLPQTFHRSHDDLKKSYRIASIFYM